MHKYLVRKKTTSYLNPVVFNFDLSTSSLLFDPKSSIFNRRYSSLRSPLLPPFVLSMKFLWNWKKWPTYRRDDEQANGHGYEPQKSVSPLSSISVKKILFKRHHHPLNRPYCSRSHPTDPQKCMTTDVFCAETLQDLPRTLFQALKDLQNLANLQFATSCLDCPHSYHIRRPTIYKS